MMIENLAAEALTGLLYDAWSRLVNQRRKKKVVVVVDGVPIDLRQVARLLRSSDSDVLIALSDLGLSAGDLARLTAASRNALETASDEADEERQPQLSAPSLAHSLRQAYVDVLGEEYPWVATSDLEVAATYLALRDSNDQEAHGREWDQLSEDANLLVGLSSPSTDLPSTLRQ